MLWCLEGRLNFPYMWNIFHMPAASDEGLQEEISGCCKPSSQPIGKETNSV